MSPEPLVIKRTIFAVCFPAPNRRKPMDYADLFLSAVNRLKFGYVEVDVDLKITAK